MNRHNDRPDLATRLAEKGIRLTRQRRLIVGVIEDSPGHLHASDILRLAREKDVSIDRSTVYRTLSLLKAHGLIDELDLLHIDGTEHHYELKGRAAHIHIGCPGCGRIFELSSCLVDRLEAEIRRQTGCEVESIRIEVASLCPECRRARR